MNSSKRFVLDGPTKFSSWSNGKTKDDRELEASAKKLRFAFHLSMSISPVMCLLILAIAGPPPEVTPENPFYPFFVHCFTYRRYFLSIWVGICQFLCFSLFSIFGLIDIKYGRNKIVVRLTNFSHTVASYLLFTIVFPLSLVICILFWSLFLYNRELIYPEILDHHIPPALNHVLHTLPVPLSCVYMIVSSRKEPPQVVSLFGLIAYLGFYYYLYVGIYLNDGKWVYVVFNLLTFAQAQYALIIVFLASIGFHFLGYKLYDSIKHQRRQSQWIRLLNGGSHVG